MLTVTVESLSNNTGCSTLTKLMVHILYSGSLIKYLKLWYLQSFKAIFVIFQHCMHKKLSISHYSLVCCSENFHEWNNIIQKASNFLMLMLICIKSKHKKFFRYMLCFLPFCEILRVKLWVRFLLKNRYIALLVRFLYD